MTQKTKLTGSGIPAAAANFIVGDSAVALTATGTTQTDALALTDVNDFTTVASGAGGRLPIATPGDTCTIYNGGANALLVYPATGDSINAVAANGSFSLAAGKGMMLVKTGATRWAGVLTA